MVWCRWFRAYLRHPQRQPGAEARGDPGERQGRQGGRGGVQPQRVGDGLVAGRGGGGGGVRGLDTCDHKPALRVRAQSSALGAAPWQLLDPFATRPAPPHPRPTPGHKQEGEGEGLKRLSLSGLPAVHGPPGTT